MILVCLVSGMAGGLIVWKLTEQSQTAPVPEPQNASVTNTEQKPAVIETQEADETTTPVAVACDPSKVVVTVNTDTSGVHHVFLDKTEIGIINPFGYDAAIFRTTESYTYIGVDVNKSGIYQGPEHLWRVNRCGKTVQDIRGQIPVGFVTDIDFGETAYAVITGPLYPGNNPTHLEVIGMESGRVRDFKIDTTYNQSGDAFFSPDAMKIAFAATRINSETNAIEKSVVFILDLSTEAISAVSPLLENGSLYHVTGWTSETQPNYFVQ